MVDAVEQARAEAAEALARGDTKAANEAYAAELRALSGSQTTPHTAEDLDSVLALHEGETDDASKGDDDDGIDWKALGEDSAEETPAGDEDRETPDEGQQQIAVEHTDLALRAFREAFGEEAARELQAKVGDQALPTLKISEAVLADDTQLRAIYDQHETADGAVSLEGAHEAEQHLIARLGVGSPEELSVSHPMLDSIFWDGYDAATGTLSAVAVHRILDYVGRKSGYRFNYRGGRRLPSNPQRKDTIMSEPQTKPSASTMSETEYENQLRDLRGQIEDAQMRGDSKRRDRLYQQELALIARVKGNGPIVNGRRTA